MGIEDLTIEQLNQMMNCYKTLSDCHSCPLREYCDNITTFQVEREVIIRDNS